MTNTQAEKPKAKLDTLEAGRLVLTIELRSALTRAAADLLSEASRHNKPSPRQPRTTTPNRKTSHAPNPNRKTKVTRTLDTSFVASDILQPC